ncbi:hypothetical protein [Pyxidicoccus xibeiensis]|uniref:hypothetical protein n=1 Tax=Pyxidicoccus xibeiensis TaxID=2906759 RepID=UPI0020A7BDD7|nr:hypothetical protein [Pyxidicoccus xibeiensis]MCP3136520.1 hypothetical protein [Pyxidicoccus xibeiensis]
MKQVVLITTGRCEQLALGASLKRYFPDATFITPEHRHSFTSTRVQLTPAPPPRPGGPEPVVDRLAKAMVAMTDPGRDGVPPDLVIAVDDVELVNLNQIEVVTSTLRNAVKRHLDTFAWSSARRREQAAERVREHCSFHLLCPMLEAYFFGEPAALTRAGAKRPSTVDAQTHDLEDFLTEEAEFLAAPTDSKHWAKADRAKHPKRYLQYLIDPEGADEKSYREAEGGMRALRDLDWSRVLSVEAHTQLARSLFSDLADALGVDSPFLDPCHPLTSNRRADRVLRNL